MPPRPSPSRVAAALDYLQRLKSGVGEFVGGVGSNLADRARAAGGLAYEALTTDPNIGRMTTAEFSQAAADRAPTPRLDQAARDIGTIGRAIVTQPVETGKAIVRGEVERAQQAMTSPRAAGQYAGSLIDPTRLAAALRHRIPISELDVYHGTPHTYAPTEANPLGEFDASKIGTGEGAQAYGHGIYFAENMDVGKGYQPRDPKVEAKLAQLYKQAEQRQDYDSMEVLEAAMLHKTAGELREMFPNQGKLADQIGKITATSKGSLYKADLPDEMIDRMLDYDKPINEQSPAVLDALERAGINTQSTALAGPMAQGQEAHLAKHGIPGLKYLDEGSRNTAGKWIAKHPQGGETAFNTEAELNAFLKRNPEMAAVKPKQTRNFVVFPGEEKKVRILKRNGQPAPERIAQALEAAPTTARRPTALPTIKPGDVVDGYKVRPDIPNQSSIAASLDNYEVLPGIRSINMTEFDPQYVRSISPDKLDSRTRKLMDEISQSKELNPLIVAYDSKGPYIIEGGHRFDALAASKAKSVPAMVVIDMDDPPR